MSQDGKVRNKSGKIIINASEEDLLRSYLGEDEYLWVCKFPIFVHGPRCSGKTTLVKRVLNKLDSVVYVFTNCLSLLESGHQFMKVIIKNLCIQASQLHELDKGNNSSAQGMIQDMFILDCVYKQVEKKTKMNAIIFHECLTQLVDCFRKFQNRKKIVLVFDDLQLIYAQASTAGHTQMANSVKGMLSDMSGIIDVSIVMISHIEWSRFLFLGSSASPLTLYISGFTKIECCFIAYSSKISDIKKTTQFYKSQKKEQEKVKMIIKSLVSFVYDLIRPYSTQLNDLLRTIDLLKPVMYKSGILNYKEDLISAYFSEIESSVFSFAANNPTTNMSTIMNAASSGDNYSGANKQAQQLELNMTIQRLQKLPIIARHVLIACYIASHAAKSADTQTFILFSDKKRPITKTVAGRQEKFKSKSLGQTFTLQRMLAVLGYLIESHNIKEIDIMRTSIDNVNQLANSVTAGNNNISYKAGLLAQGPIKTYSYSSKLVGNSGSIIERLQPRQEGKNNALLFKKNNLGMETFKYSAIETLTHPSSAYQQWLANFLSLGLILQDSDSLFYERQLYVCNIPLETIQALTSSMQINMSHFI